jgi:hypothetical protein
VTDSDDDAVSVTTATGKVLDSTDEPTPSMSSPNGGRG